MRIELKALRAELPVLMNIETEELCEMLARLGFPVDAVEDVNGRIVLEVDVTANRGDALSHRGMARDLAAKMGTEPGPISFEAVQETSPILPLRLEAGDACPMYATAILVLGDKHETPKDVKAFLASMNSTAKDMASVDASNELLHRYGHPTHAFDADTLQGAVVVRWAREGETLVTLDGIERKLSAKDLVIADEARAIALAGVMGGDATKVTTSTRRVLLESAYFDPRTVRATARRHDLHTDASHRFGRGADSAMPRVARDLLVRRLAEWTGAVLIGAWTEGEAPANSRTIRLSEDLLNRIAGEPISIAAAANALKRLGCKITHRSDYLDATPPSWRHDLSIPEDLAEEILRLRGYEAIGSALPPLEGAPEPLSQDYIKHRKIAIRIANLGFHQTVTLGFVSPEMDASLPPVGDVEGDNSEARTLSNPLGLDYSVMRGSLLSSLKAAADHNLRQGAKEVRLFEIAPVHRGHKDGTTEHMHLAFVWNGEYTVDSLLTQRKIRKVQEADLLGVAADLGFRGRADVVELGEGLLGLELPLDSLEDASDTVIPAFRPFSRFMRVERDLSLMVDLDQSYEALVQAMAKPLPGDYLVEGPVLVDIFRHKSLPVGKQAWLMRMVFQAEDRTLTSEEVDAWVAKALDAARSFGAELRS